MRIESSVTAISWIPSEAIKGMPKVPFELGIGKYDEPPPDQIEDLDALRDADRFREANELRAWIEVENGKIVNHGHEGRALIGTTTFKLGIKDLTFAAVPYPVLRPEPEVWEDSVRFIQTAGGRAGFPAPRRVRGKPFFKIAGATAWTTLALTIKTDGTSEHQLVGASVFPRHWVYDADGQLVQKAGTIDFKEWYRESFGENTPWGEKDQAVLVADAETALERELSRSVMREGKTPKQKKLKEGAALIEQGEPGEELYLLLDGILMVEVDGKPIAEIGPGSIVGERAVLEGGARTATLRAMTPARVAVVGRDDIAESAMAELAAGRRREG
jgi:cyclic nucleotide-binding protein